MAPVFIVEEDIRPLDLTANVEHLIIKDMGNLSDMNLQHPELIPLLLATEPQLKENEWIEVKGLMSRSNSAEMQKKEGQNDDACICIVERTKNLQQETISLAQGSSFTILERCFQDSSGESSRSKTASFSSKLPSTSEYESESEYENLDEENSERKPKRLCFEDRLKMALERGSTPEDESNENENFQNGEEGQSLSKMNFRRILSDEDQQNRLENQSCGPPDSSIFSEDSMYSFESLIVPYEMEGTVEDLQANLTQPLHKDEFCLLRSLAITEELKRMCLSEAYLDLALHLDKTSEKISKFPRFTKSDLGNVFQPQKYKRQRSKTTDSTVLTSGKLPIWIINHSTDVDTKRFLVEWLAASVQDVPLVVYQSSNGAMCTDIIAAICSWIEEQSWTTEELFNALTNSNAGKMFN